MSTKICKKCEKEKDKTSFYRHKAVCKECVLNNKKKCKYCLKFFVNLENHEKTMHQKEEEINLEISLQILYC